MSERTASYKRNNRLESLLAELSATLGPAEETISAPDAPQMPVVLVVGPPRSGTTVMLQWLAGTDHFAYPSNLMSRFFAAPYLGSRIQQLLFDPACDYKGELTVRGGGGDLFASALGKTRGPLQPSEFWYFWRRFFDVPDPERIAPEAFEASDQAGFLRGLARIESAWERPFAMKGILLQYNLAELDAMFPHVVFIRTRRQPFYNVQSILRARVSYWGNEDAWFSVKPPGHEPLHALAPVEQVAGQVRLTQSWLDDELDGIDPARHMTVDYEDFCASTSGVWSALRERFRLQGFELPPSHKAPTAFENKNLVHVDDAKAKAIRAALA